MSEERDTLEIVARHLTAAMQPLIRAVNDENAFRALMLQLGWQTTGLPPAYTGLGSTIAEAVQAVEALGDDPNLNEILNLLSKARDAFEAIRGISTAPPGVDAGAFLSEIGERLFELLLTDYLALQLPTVFNLLSMLNVIEVENVAPTANKTGHIRTRFKWEEIPHILTDPASLPQRVYGWGTPDLNSYLLLQHVSELFFALKFPVVIEMADELLAEGYQATGSDRNLLQLKVPFYYITIADKNLEAAFSILELRGDGGKLPGVIIQPEIPEQFPATFHLAQDIDLNVQAGTNLASLFGLLIRPDEVSVKYPFEQGGTPLSASFGIQFNFHPQQHRILLGNPHSTRLQLQGFSAGIRTNLNDGQVEAIIDAELKGLALILAAGEADSFMRHFLGDGESKIDVPLGVEWSNRYGFRFKGSAAFEVALHPHLSLGPISIGDVVISLTAPAGPQPKVSLAVGLDVSGHLGPLTFVVQQIGLNVQTTFVKGNAGPFDIKLGFKPPTAMGLSVDAGGFKGGGFLGFDPDKGEYAGMLELEFQGVVSLKAIAVVNTKLPDGQDGFSLLIIITAEFTPIQLGFGFTLMGVGGLLGLNRTAVIEVLRTGVRDGSLNSVLFPQDVVANAPRIIKDLKRIFPAQDGHFLVAPMAKFGWGTPTLISLELGLLLDLPRPAFALLGVLRVNIPEEHLALLKIQVNFLGVVDFDKKQISFDASLYDSRLLTFTLTGDMALRLYYGDDANFLLTVGGFHPSYTPPPMALGRLRRLAIVIFSSSPSLRAEVYFAVTSNTVQFGAKIELLAGGRFKIYGFLSLDVLIQFSPFHFVAEIAAMLAVMLGSHTLFAVKLKLTLEGPTPWHARGEASFEIGFVFTITIRITFNATFGEDRHDTLPPIEVMPELEKALANRASWRAALPPQNSLMVSLREVPDAGGAIVLHPFGTLQVSQKVVPLNLDIDKFGNQRPASDHRFRISSVSIGNETDFRLDTLKEQFAPAQFIEMGDAEKISRRSFEEMDAGLEVSDSVGARTDYAVRLDVEYEVIYLPEKKRPLFIRLAVAIFDLFLTGNATAKSPLSYERRSASVLGAERVVLNKEQFAVASTSTLQLHQGTLLFDSETEARASLKSLLRNDPQLAGEVQVVPSYQLNRS
jgi:hypothetical protein